MKTGIMQPYFFPYIGYFSLIKNVDLFILLDEVQFIRHGWIERNRILKPREGWQYISIPLKKHSQKTLIKDIEINNTSEWRQKIFGQLTHYAKAPFYRETVQLLTEILDQDFLTITQLDQRSLEMVCQYLNIKTPIQIFSQMNLEIEKVTAPDEWALNICKVLPNVTEYWNPPGGKAFFDTKKYSENQINIQFIQMNEIVYQQGRRTGFEPGLSIIDVLMYNPKEKVLDFLDQYSIL